ncbi:hypothetical protein ILYODFUR_017061 [Ilyodon furcidens]|uniref:Uncharacterized protein n=1 Tax=Ilyodon furcidens TaxID=33524 RepID=A0ABV0VEP6_9TELE
MTCSMHSFNKLVLNSNFPVTVFLAVTSRKVASVHQYCNQGERLITNPILLAMETHACVRSTTLPLFSLMSTPEGKNSITLQPEIVLQVFFIRCCEKVFASLHISPILACFTLKYLDLNNLYTRYNQSK